MPTERERPAGVAWREVTRVQAGQVTHANDGVAEEVPVAVQVNGEPFAVMMATPADLEDFAYGFAFTELGLSAPQLRDVRLSTLLEGMQLDIQTLQPVPINTEDMRNLPGRSGCGVCGLRRLEDVVKQPATVRMGQRIGIAALEAALSNMQSRQHLNAASGAHHAAAWADADGQLRYLREDIGRHNALDKLIGALQRDDVDLEHGFALVTSRASYEMVTKAALAGMPVLLAISAPTALAVDLARSCGMTLAGFARSGRHVIYSHPWRLVSD